MVLYCIFVLIYISPWISFWLLLMLKVYAFDTTNFDRICNQWYWCVYNIIIYCGIGRCQTYNVSIPTPAVGVSRVAAPYFNVPRYYMCIIVHCRVQLIVALLRYYLIIMGNMRIPIRFITVLFSTYARRVVAW